MDKKEVVWVTKPEDDAPSGASSSITFRLSGEWWAVDQDQLLLPITLLERDGEEIGEDGGLSAVLKQYGGDGVLNSMLLSDQKVEPGSTWRLERTAHRRTVEPAD